MNKLYILVLLCTPQTYWKCEGLWQPIYAVEELYKCEDISQLFMNMSPYEDIFMCLEREDI